MLLVVPYDLGDKMDSTKSYSRLFQARLRQDEVRQVILLAVPDTLKNHIGLAMPNVAQDRMNLSTS